MINSLTAKKLNISKVEEGRFELKKNTPVQIDKDHNNIVISLHELGDSTDELCLINSVFHDGATALVGKEFRLNYLRDAKKVDLSYYYFAESKRVFIYLYDLKKTLAGIEVMIHLVEQWTSSVCDARYCVEKMDGYSLSDADIHIGVITEENDEDRRRRELNDLFTDDPIPDGVNSFTAAKHKVSDAGKIVKRKLLKGFDEGNVTIKGITFTFDVRMIQNKEHQMFFTDGILVS